MIRKFRKPDAAAVERSRSLRAPTCMLNPLRALVLPFSLCFAVSGCSDDASKPGEERGALVKVDAVGSLDAAAVRRHLTKFELDASRVRSGVEAYRLVYETVDAKGKPTTASTLLAIPTGDAATLRAAVWMHGTTVFRGEAASVDEESSDRAATFFFAAAGYATTAPDYLGLGEGPGTHPYDDADTEVSASVDALLAATQFLKERGMGLGTDVVLTGHSQGARATLELGKALQDGAIPGLHVVALAPISGPYDMSDTLSIAVTDGIAFATAYLSYLVVAWNRLHHLYDSPRDAFLPPYDGTIETLFDNNHPPDEVLGALPETLEELFTPAFLAELRNPHGALKAALERADTACSYQSDVPVHLFAARGDVDVPISNAEHCRAELERHEALVELVDVGAVDHSASANVALPLVLDVFDGRR
jgi:acetyl esterase/lipase